MTVIGYIRGQHPDAIPNGSRVRKAITEPGDAHEAGALATVLSSVGGPVDGQDRILYFVEWDDTPGIPCAIADYRIEDTGS